MTTLREDVCNFERLIYFTKKEQGDNSTEGEIFDPSWVDIVGEYHAKAQLVQVGIDDPDIIHFYNERRVRYGLIIGQMGVGKTKIAKKLKKYGIVKLYRLDKYRTKMIDKINEGDNPIDDLSNEQAYELLKKELLEAPLDQITLFDDFPFKEGGFQKIVNCFGTPQYILRLDASEETVLDRFKKKNDIEELSDEDQEYINASASLHEELNNAISNIL